MFIKTAIEEFPKGLGKIYSHGVKMHGDGYAIADMALSLGSIVAGTVLMHRALNPRVLNQSRVLNHSFLNQLDTARRAGKFVFGAMLVVAGVANFVNTWNPILKDACTFKCEKVINLASGQVVDYVCSTVFSPRARTSLHERSLLEGQIDSLNICKMFFSE